MKLVRIMDNTPFEDLIRFHSNEAQSLLKKHQAIEELIGKNHHNPTVGYHCEVLLKEYLRQNLPNRYSIDTGFVKCTPITDGMSNIIATPQIDILVHDENEYAPIYRTGDYVIVEPEAVQAIIEVKKELTITELNNALENISDSFALTSKDRIYTPERIFKAIVGFSTNIGKDGKKLKEILTRFVSDANYIRILPDLIVVFDEYFMQIVFSNKTETYECKIFPAITNIEGEEIFLSLQYLLYSLRMKALSELSKKYSVFAFPNAIQPLQTYQISVPATRNETPAGQTDKGDNNSAN
ncbi:MAG: hypothetical protein BWX73_00942 [Lentisphaerae bacterium ADurb.Bin082]|nr:MAG: hypothetical protein BWX73_00942 [Lentisphaerae bacterium ADurb.Bin082]